MCCAVIAQPGSTGIACNRNCDCKGAIPVSGMQSQGASTSRCMCTLGGRIRCNSSIACNCNCNCKGRTPVVMHAVREGKQQEIHVHPRM